MIPDLIRCWKYGTAPMKPRAEIEAAKAKVVESLAESAPQILIQTSLIVMFVTEFVREQG